ncbi:hypothetical protein [Saccharopolyspora shandongensis]|uniref:hypothetical protein n=1 Tax=Saccharopolyspora shandongensis TaxID=418495 RepID=UPI0033D72849
MQDRAADQSAERPDEHPVQGHPPLRLRIAGHHAGFGAEQGAFVARDQLEHLAAAAYAIYLGTAALNSAAAASEDIESYVDAVLESFGVPANR